MSKININIGGENFIGELVDFQFTAINNFASPDVSDVTIRREIGSVEFAIALTKEDVDLWNSAIERVKNLLALSK